VALLGGVVMFWLNTGISYTAFHYTIFHKHTKNIRTNHGNGPENEEPITHVASSTQVKADKSAT
jgi:hypothetical protein